MINLAAVRATGSIPRVHGNGFIQLDLAPRSRLHVWGDPRIPKQKTRTPIHDHVFGFKSTILFGRMLNVVYDIVPHISGDYDVYTSVIRDRDDSSLEDTMQRVHIVQNHVDLVRWNSARATYVIRPFEFHESIPLEGPAATVIIKDGLTQAQGAKAQPRILVPVGITPDNEFSRYDADPDLLWRIIEDTLKLRTR